MVNVVTSPTAEFLMRCRVGGELLGLRPLDEGPDAPWRQRHPFNIMPFTEAGAELTKIVHATPNPEYLASLREWSCRLFGLVPE